MNVLIFLYPNSNCLALPYWKGVKCAVGKIRKPSTCLLILLCFLIKHTAVAQNYEHKIDSINTVLAASSKEDTSRANALVDMARLQTFKPGGEVLKYANEALELSKRLDYKTGIIKACFVLAYHYELSGNSVRALRYLYKALDLSIEKQNKDLEADCYNFLGYINKSLERYAESLTYYKKALAHWKRQKDPNMEALILCNMADIYFAEGNDEKAFEYYSQTLNLAKEYNLERRLTSVYNSLGKFYYRNKELEKALEYQQSSLKQAIKNENTISQSEAYRAMSEVYLAQDNLQEALYAAEKALHFARLGDSKHDISKSYQLLYTSLQKSGSYKKAYEYQSKYIALHDSLKNLEDVKVLERLKYQHEIELMTGRNKTNIIRRNALIGVLVSILLIGFLIHNRQYLLMKKKLDSNRQQLNFSIRNLKEKSELVDKVNRELEIFKKHASHDVKIKKFNRVLQLNIVTDDDWENFKDAFEDVYPNFMASLRYHYPNLTTSEIRQAALIKMKLTIKETASVLGITPESVKKSRHRLRKKLELNEDETIESVLDTLHTNISKG